MRTLEMQGRKWDIFISAINLFSEHGYENVSMRNIAAANGMRAASIYNHFQSKELILDQIYQFYRENVMDVFPDLDEILSLASKKSPGEVLHRTMAYYGEELQPIMDKICLIAIMRAHRDQKAHELIWKYNIENLKIYYRAVLRRMIDCGRIEPLDLESFLEILAGFAFTAMFRNHSSEALGLDKWLRGLDMLFSLVKEAPGL